MSKALSSCKPFVHKHKNKIYDCCVYFHLAKSHQLPFSLATLKASLPLELLHMDLWGPSPFPSTLGVRYCFLIVDDFSLYTWVYFIPTKDQVLNVFITF